MKPSVVEAILDKWKPLLGLDGWVVLIRVKNSYCPGDSGVQAEIDVDLKYHEAILKIYKPFWTDPPERQVQTIVHELVHILLSRLDSHLPPSSEELVEETTQTLAMLFYKYLR